MGVIMKNKVNYTGGGSGGASALADLEDVELTTPTDGQALVYDAENDLWINGGVVGSGGGSAKYSETVLWNGSKNTTGTITLSESIKNFSIIMIMISSHPSNTNYYKIPWYILVSEITDYTTTYQFEPFGVRGAENVNDRACMLSLHFTDDTSISIDEVSHGSNAMATLLKVIGIKWETMQTALIYSEEEREVGVWTDGKPLYQKTFIFSNISTLAGNQSYQTDLSNVDEAFLEGEIIEGVNRYAIPWAGLNGYALGFFFNTSTNYIYTKGADTFSNATLKITVKYTKTTDTAGSGIWTTTGEYAHHYSTTEHVVGTWTDGKPLYEIAVSLASDIVFSNNNWVNVVAIADYDIDKVASLTLYNKEFSRPVNYAMSDVSGGYVKAWFVTNAQWSFKSFVIRYTKTTD